MTRMESVKNMFESAEKEKTDTDKKQKSSRDELTGKNGTAGIRSLHVNSRLQHK